MIRCYECAAQIPEGQITRAEMETGSSSGYSVPIFGRGSVRWSGRTYRRTVSLCPICTNALIRSNKIQGIKNDIFIFVVIALAIYFFISVCGPFNIKTTYVSPNDFPKYQPTHKPNQPQQAVRKSKPLSKVQYRGNEIQIIARSKFKKPTSNTVTTLVSHGKRYGGRIVSVEAGFVAIRVLSGRIYLLSKDSLCPASKITCYREDYEDYMASISK